MRIGDLLYFAPGLRFDQVDLDGPALPDQFRQRTEGFYLLPAEDCAAHQHAFAAGVLLVSCIDALARVRFGVGVGERFKRFARYELKSFAAGDLAERFYLDFRNGLIHEARLKEGGQFSLEVEKTAQEIDGILLVNPGLLIDEVRSALAGYVAQLHGESSERAKLADVLRQDHAKDFLAASS
jgi:hypothetical protein